MIFPTFFIVALLATTTHAKSVHRHHSGKISLAQFLTKLPDVAEKLNLSQELWSRIKHRYAEYKETKLYYNQGECIAVEDQPETDIYHILKGRVEIFKTDKQTREKESVVVKQEGSTFGEIPYKVVERFLDTSSTIKRLVVLVGTRSS